MGALQPLIPQQMKESFEEVSIANQCYEGLKTAFTIQSALKLAEQCHFLKCCSKVKTQQIKQHYTLTELAVVGYVLFSAKAKQNLLTKLA